MQMSKAYYDYLHLAYRVSHYNMKETEVDAIFDRMDYLWEEMTKEERDSVGKGKIVVYDGNDILKGLCSK